MANTYNPKQAKQPQQPKRQGAIAKPESQLFALVEADSSQAKADMERLKTYGQARTTAVTNAFQQVIDQSNQDIAQFITERYDGDQDFFDPLAYLDFSPQIGLSSLPTGDVVTVAALPES